MKSLNEIYPLVTKSMWLCHVFITLIIFMVTLVFTMADKDTPLKAYLITVGAGAALTGIPIFGFIQQLQCRHWVRSHCIGWGYGVMYLADRVQDIEKLRKEVRRLCVQDVVGMAMAQLGPYVASMKFHRPDVVLAIAQTIVTQTDTRRGKSWRVGGLQLGHRVWLTWRAGNLRAYRGLFGHELGEMLLSCGGYQGDRQARYRSIQIAGLDGLFQETGDIIRKTVSVGEA